MKNLNINRFYVYCHRRKTDGKCFYIGKGSGRRYIEKCSRNQHWWNIVNKHGFEAEILVNNINEMKAFELEAEFCKQIGYENLCNINQELGNGGHTRSEETKVKISEKLKGHTFNRGKIRTEEQKRNMSLAKLGKSKPKDFGKKISESKKGKNMSEETKQKIGKSKKGNTYSLGLKHSEETKQKISEALRGSPKNKKPKNNV